MLFLKLWPNFTHNISFSWNISNICFYDFKKIALDQFINFLFFIFFCLAQSSLLKEKIDIFNYNKSSNISSNRDGLMILS